MLDEPGSQARCTLTETNGSEDLLNSSGDQREQADLVTSLFHRINRVLPEAQELVTVTPNCKIREAIQMMTTKRFSQLPVVADGGIIGVFTFRKFAQFIARKDQAQWKAMGCEPGDLTVDHCYERFAFVGLTDEMTAVMDLLDRDDAVLVGTAEKPHGMLTGIDIARYLHEIAGPFVLILEIELCLRALIQKQLSKEQIEAAGVAVLSALYEGRTNKIPKTLEQMTLDNYQSIVVHDCYWPRFQSVFGVNRVALRGKLRQIGDLRNDIFHFKRNLELGEYQDLVDCRDWFLSRASQLEVMPRDGGSLAEGS